VLGPPKANSARRASIFAQSCQWDRPWNLGADRGVPSFFLSKDAAGKNTGSQRLDSLILASELVVIVSQLIIFSSASVSPDNQKAEDDIRRMSSTPEVSHSIWAHSHFYASGRCPVSLRGSASRHLYASSFNYIDRPSSRPSRQLGRQNLNNLAGPFPGVFCETFLLGWFELDKTGDPRYHQQASLRILPLSVLCAFLWTFTGAGLLRKYSAPQNVGLYGVMNVLMCMLIFCKTGLDLGGWRLPQLFLLSIMFPTIFALGIFGLGARAKRPPPT